MQAFFKNFQNVTHNKIFCRQKTTGRLVGQATTTLYVHAHVAYVHHVHKCTYVWWMYNTCTWYTCTVYSRMSANVLYACLWLRDIIILPASFNSGIFVQFIYTPGHPPPHLVLFRVRVCLFPPFKSTPLSQACQKILNPPFAGFSRAFPALETPLNPEHCSMYPPPLSQVDLIPIPYLRTDTPPSQVSCHYNKEIFFNVGVWLYPGHTCFGYNHTRVAGW